MSTCGTRGRGTRCRGRGGKGAQAESSSMDNISNLDTSETPVSPVTKIESHVRMVRDDTLYQVMLRILERIVRPNIGFGGRGSVTERLWFNGAELFNGVIGVTQMWPSTGLRPRRGSLMTWSVPPNKN